MAIGFKQRLSRVIPSFQSCRSKDPDSLPENPVPSSVFCLSPINPRSMDLRFPTAPSPCHHKRRQLLSSAAVSVGCGCRSKPGRRRVHDRPNKGLEVKEYRWGREQKLHVVAPRQKIDFNDLDECTDASTDYSGSDAPTATDMRKKDKMNKKKKSKRYSKKKKRLSGRAILRPGRFSYSTSADSGWFSSEERGYNAYNEDDDETETCLMSCQSLSTSSSASDSAEVGLALAPIREKSSQAPQVLRGHRSVRGTRVKKMGADRMRRNSKASAEVAEEEVEGEARVSVLRRLMPWRVEGKVMRESMAVVKRSQDPYEDFRRSMAEMIVEKGMYDDAGELEQLLRCFLSLNSRTHHPVILQAFSDIWDALFLSCSAP